MRDYRAAVCRGIKAGERHKVVTGIAGKTGIVYTLDRQNGEFLWATPTVCQSVVSKMNGVTGTVTVNPETVFNKVGSSAPPPTAAAIFQPAPRARSRTLCVTLSRIRVPW